MATCKLAVSQLTTSVAVSNFPSSSQSSARSLASRSSPNSVSILEFFANGGLSVQSRASPVAARPFGPASASCLESLGLGVGRETTKRRNGRLVAVRVAEIATPAVASPNPSGAAAGAQVRPSPAEAARTIVDICTEGTLSTLSDDEWPTATAVRFALDAEGNPVFRFPASALHTRNLAADNRSSLHVQKLDVVWERRFGKERAEEDSYYVMIVEQALHAQDMGEDEVWVSGGDFNTAVADPLRECATRIVEDMNRKHWEDVRRFCNSHARLEAEVEEASMTWVDRLGFDLRILTRSPQTLLEVRIPFSREVSDERDARSSLTMMAQIAWEHERNYSPPDVQLLGTFNVSS